MLRVKKISMRQIRRYFKNREGTAAIEFAILAIPFFMLLFAILELAIVFFINSTLTHSVPQLTRLENISGKGIRLLSATTAFKNEPFPAPGTCPTSTAS